MHDHIPCSLDFNELFFSMLQEVCLLYPQLIRLLGKEALYGATHERNGLTDPTEEQPILAREVLRSSGPQDFHEQWHQGQSRGGRLLEKTHGFSPQPRADAAQRHAQNHLR